MISIVNEVEEEVLPENLAKDVEMTIGYVLSHEGVTYKPEISILVIDNQGIKEINKDTRGIDEVTDVLSFPMLDYDEGKTYQDLYTHHVFGPEYFDGEALVLGDVVLSLEKAKEQANEYGHSLKREICYLVAHSVFHLLGYDHMTKEDKIKMRDAEEKVLKALAITRE